MSLFHPPVWFPPQLAFLWPLIWVQVLVLRAQIRAAYGRGVVYRWSLTPNLRVYLVRIDWMPGQKTERAILQTAVHASDRLAAACDGRAAVPVYITHLSISAQPGENRYAGAVRAVLAALAPGLRRDARQFGTLPLPET
ncbi:hypothetical protein [Hyphomonas sp.]|mgnify:CR=1 FL=1|uniref:hypothetical protein n=1 Tax=Hyphomonas sp. TaxID=87 RepID=UPI000C524D6B|nr:hypothetical protein [Hyphomonas sp.]MAU65547.1 hypothetical protein [Hyphomonas sp.]MBM59336.1 hypothetical protein [Hyphomonas sp.]